MSSCVSVKGVHTRQSIVEAAYDLLHSEGYKKMSMEDIASRAGVSRAAVYLHFKDKNDVVMAVLRHLSEKDLISLKEVVRQKVNPAEKVRSFLSKKVMLKIGRCNESGASFDELFSAIRMELLDFRAEITKVETELLAEILIEGRLLGVFDVENVITTAESMVMSIQGFSPYNLTIGERLNEVVLEQRVHRVIDMCLRGIISDSKQRTELDTRKSKLIIK